MICPTKIRRRIYFARSETEVNFELIVNNKSYNYSSARSGGPYDISYEAPYEVFVKDCDYKSLLSSELRIKLDVLGGD